MTDPTTKAEPIVFERDGFKRQLMVRWLVTTISEATSDDLRAAGWVPASELAELRAENARLKAERGHLLEAAELLRENPSEERWRWLRIQWLDRDNGRFPKTGSDQAKAAARSDDFLEHVRQFQNDAPDAFADFDRDAAVSSVTKHDDILQKLVEQARDRDQPKAADSRRSPGGDKEADEGYRSLLKDYMNDKERHRATATKLEAAERELAHCREAAELLRAIPGFWAASVEWKQRRVEWLHRDQAKAAEPEAPGREPERCLLCGSNDRRSRLNRLDGSIYPCPSAWHREEPEATAVAEPWVPKVGEAIELEQTRWNPMMRTVTWGDLVALLEHMTQVTHGNVLSGYEQSLEEARALAKKATAAK